MAVVVFDLCLSLTRNPTSRIAVNIRQVKKFHDQVLGIFVALGFILVISIEVYIASFFLAILQLLTVAEVHLIELFGTSMSASNRG